MEEGFQMAAGKTIKMSVNLSEEIVDALKSIAKIRGVNMTEALRQAISTEKFFLDEVADGNKILLEDKKKKFRQIVLR